VEETLRVDERHAVEQRVEHLADLVLGDRPVPFQDLAEAHAFLVGHHEIGRAVRLEKAIEAHDVGMVERHQRLRLLAEALDAEIERHAVARADRMHRNGVAPAYGDGRRQILLDRHLAADQQLRRPIGNAEAARAELLLDAVALELVALGQRIKMRVRHRAPCRADRAVAKS
jgi:hypothetical protein